MSAATSGAYAVAEGEPSALGFAALYREHASFTWACLRRLGVPPAAIDDAMQELWVTAHRRLATLHAPSAAKSWLYGIARRVASHQRRSDQRHRRKVDAIGDVARRHDDTGRESELVVESILAQLDARVREAFVLSELEGWSAPEIARATGANTNTIYWRVRVARQELQSQLGADEGTASARVIELREATRAPKGATRHCWMLIAPKLAAPSVLGSLFGGWGSVKALAVAAGVTIAAATTIEVAARGATEPARVDVIAEVAPPPTPPSPEPARPPVVDAAPIAAPPAAVPIEAPVKASARSRVASPEAPVTAPAGMATEDAALLRDAQLAITQGRFGDAEAALVAHRERHPSSALGDLRELLDVKLHCARNDVDGARRLADAILARAPESATARKLGTTCVGSKP